MMYLKVQHDYLKSYASPQDNREVLNKYAINTVLIPLPRAQTHNGDWVNPLRDFYPSSMWALVFFEKKSVVLLRRTPAHEKIISENEYTWLIPQELPEVSIDYAKKHNAIEKLKLEVERCLRLDSGNFSCHLIYNCMDHQVENLGSLFKDPSNRDHFHYLLEVAEIRNTPTCLGRLIKLAL